MNTISKLSRDDVRFKPIQPVPDRNAIPRDSDPPRGWTPPIRSERIVSAEEQRLVDMRPPIARGRKGPADVAALG